MDTLKCKECELVFETIDSLRRHRVQKHKVNAEQTYIDYKLDGVNPVCKCGCGERPKFLGIDTGFRDYKLGHAARVNNNWGHNKRALSKSHETQRKMYSDGSLEIWNKGLTVDDSRVLDNITKVISNPKRGGKISKALSGVPKSDEHKNKLKECSKLRWDKLEEREKQSERLINRLIKNNYRNGKTKLETNFEGLLNSLNVNFKYQHQVSSAIFDFLIIDKNILIEVDGDFHHCNPNSKHKIPVHPIQIKTVGNDIRKNRIAEDNGFILLRFWESDINNKPDEVIRILRQELL
jgi:very-short-patch-repair endonuclease